MSPLAPPSGWETWSDQATKVVLVYRPDVFDTSAFPAPCLPTLYLTKGRRDRRPGQHRPSPDDDWVVTLYLEPEVRGPSTTHETRPAAETAATGLARRFDAGEIDYRALYQVPREAYLDRLDQLTGRTPPPDDAAE